MLILGTKLTCVKFSGLFDKINENTYILGTVALWEMCHIMFFFLEILQVDKVLSNHDN